MGSYLSCVRKRPNRKRLKKGPQRLDNVTYDPDGHDDGDRNTTHAAAAADTQTRSSVYSFQRPVSNTSDTLSVTSNSHTAHHKEAGRNSSNNNNNKPPRTSVALLPPTAKHGYNERARAGPGNTVKPVIFHDVNGYAMPFARPSSSACPDSNKAFTPKYDRSHQSRSALETELQTVQTNKNIQTRAVLPKTKQRNGDYETVKKAKTERISRIVDAGPETVPYCNVAVIEKNVGQPRENTISFDNELYQDTNFAVTKVKAGPSVAPKPTTKPDNHHLHYIEVEFVQHPESKSKHPEVKRTATPTQYTDVINDNGVVRIIAAKS